MKYQAEVQRALADPGLVELTDSGWQASPWSTLSVDVVPVGAPLDYPVVYPSLETVEIPSHMVSAPTPRALYAAAQTYAALIGQQPSYELYRREIICLKQSQKVARILGGAAGTFTLSIYSNEQHAVRGCELGYLPESLHTNVLGQALLAGYPERVSNSALATVRACGFENIRELATKAQQEGLPIPLSMRRRSALSKVLRSTFSYWES